MATTINPEILKIKNAVNWFEIPVKDFSRAKKFYETVLKIEMHVCPERQWGFFPFDMPNGGIGGTIVKNSKYEPSKTGSLIYLNGGEDLSEPLSRVEEEGGSIILPKTSIDPNGFIAHFIDTEGNKVGLHSLK